MLTGISKLKASSVFLYMVALFCSHLQLPAASELRLLPHKAHRDEVERSEWPRAIGERSALWSSVLGEEYLKCLPLQKTVFRQNTMLL